MGMRLRLKRFEQIYIDILKKPPGLHVRRGKRAGAKALVSILTSQKQHHDPNCGGSLKCLEFAVSGQRALYSLRGRTTKECSAGLVTGRSPSSSETLEKEKKKSITQ